MVSDVDSNIQLSFSSPLFVCLPSAFFLTINSGHILALMKYALCIVCGVDTWRESSDDMR